MALRGNVDYTHPKLTEKLPLYCKIQDCLDGETRIKARRELYLPIPNAADESDENKLRYNAYILRANFYNVSERTLSGLVGQIYTRDPEIQVPNLLDIVIKDVSGEGVSIEQQSEEACKLVLSKGRAGLYVDYPDTEGKAASIQDVESGNIRPTIALYAPENIINWRTKKVGAKTFLSLVVLAETYTPEDQLDTFEEITKKQWRVLRLDENDNYLVEVYREENPAVIDKSFWPTDAKGAK